MLCWKHLSLLTVICLPVWLLIVFLIAQLSPGAGSRWEGSEGPQIQERLGSLALCREL